MNGLPDARETEQLLLENQALRERLRRTEESLRRMQQGIVEATLNLHAAMKQFKNAQAQLIHSEKMAVIGQLVSGVAHELNNPLTTVLGYGELLLGQTLDDAVKVKLEKIYSEAQRAARIVQNLLSFARKHKPEKTLVQINELLSNVLELRAYEFKVNNIHLETHLDPCLPLTVADGYQLQQVFLNIITNAEQAILANGKEASITVATSAIPSPADDVSPQKRHGSIRVDITDDGPGIPEPCLDRIFDPFFTTKPVGHGTGLGLSICCDIINNHGGTISVTSPPEGADKGTRFSLQLPVTKLSEQNRPPDD
jgi:two-component system NtrC family sensor kinase